MLELRPYQHRMIVDAREALRALAAVLLQLPTGGGKTALSTQMLKNVCAKGRRGMFTVHRQELIEQTMSTFTEFGIPYGVIAAGYPANPLQPIQIASIDTLRARLARGKPMPEADVCIWDEAHHIAAKGWTLVKGAYPKAKHVGLTATPERLDGKGLNEQFAAMVCGPTTAELIAQGFLAKYRAFAPSTPNMTGVHTSYGDYQKGELGALMDRPTITGNAIEHYFQHARDKRALVFCVSVKHSENVCEQFRQAGVVAWHLDGGSNRDERIKAVAAFRQGEIKVLTNVDLFGEGFDVPAADASILLRPTQSLALYLQQCGRVLRPSDGKSHAILLDHAGNIARHGLPDDERQWSLEGRDKKKKAEASVGVRQCSSCFACFPVTKPICPECGVVYPLKPRVVDEVDGSLSEIDLERVRIMRSKEAADCQSLDDLVALARARNYRHPEKFAAHYWTSRQHFIKKQQRGAA